VLLIYSLRYKIQAENESIKIDVFDTKLGLNTSIFFNSLLLIFCNGEYISNGFSTYISNVSIYIIRSKFELIFSVELYQFKHGPSFIEWKNQKPILV